MAVFASKISGPFHTLLSEIKSRIKTNMETCDRKQINFRANISYPIFTAHGVIKVKEKEVHPILLQNKNLKYVSSNLVV